MKKSILPIALLIAAAVPFVSQAQDNNKEVYLRPSNWNPYDKRGVNTFETSKAADTIPFDGLRIRFGAGFTMQYQNIEHKNTAINNTGTGSNRLYAVAPGFMTSQANLFTDVQLADGVRMNVTTYLSSRHHNEAWVKGGYIQIDKTPFLKSRLLDKIFEVATVKVGHMEINYGDAHFRRPDGGHTLPSPFMEGNIADAFATEIGGEVYVQKNGLFGMLGVSSGMIKGHVDSVSEAKVGTFVTDANTKRSPSIYLKGGIDKNLAEKLRVRLSGSLYTNSSNAGSGLTLYSGDRTGSNYQNIMETYYAADGTVKAGTSMYSSGRFNPGFSKKITAVMLNSLIKVGGLEFFGTYETAKGRSKSELNDRNMTQVAGEVIYRFGKNENFYLGGRYNTVKADMLKTAVNASTVAAYRDWNTFEEVNIDRTAFAAGWFLTRNVLLKAEIVNQKYKGFENLRNAAGVANTDFRSGGKFNGYVIEAVVGF
ncbi:hypothetical protein HRH25_05220 [Flavisolibacter sp. BT320]|nr:hypothetical protein [Flavisolibacter longurius]